MPRLSPLCLVAIALVGCTDARGDVRIEDVRVESTTQNTRVSIDAVNVGPVSAWIHTWPWQLAIGKRNDEVIIGLHADDPGLEDPPAGLLTPVIRYERLASAANPLSINEHTIEIVLPNQLGPIDDQVFVPDVPLITVELAWHEENPGSDVTLDTAPDPAGVAVYTWMQQSY